MTPRCARIALSVTFLVTLAASSQDSTNGVCSRSAAGEATCSASGASGVLREHVLLQRSRVQTPCNDTESVVAAHAGPLSAHAGPLSSSMFPQGERTCEASEVMRRRRAGSMCSCRRRSGPTCQGDKLSLAVKTGREIKVMSYNLMGWNAFNQNRWRGKNVMEKIKAWSPAALGAQEVEKGGYGYKEVKDELKEGTYLSHVGGSQFFASDTLEQHETEWTDLVGGYWLSMTRFRHKPSGVYFLFFNSHWKHGYGTEQAKIITDAVVAARNKYDSAPVVLVGDTNQFCHGYESSAWKYLMGEEGSSPVVFQDALEHDQGKSFSDSNNPDCRVDFILFTKGEWAVRQSGVDRDGMGAFGYASDHAPLMAELVLLVKEQNMST